MEERVSKISFAEKRHRQRRISDKKPTTLDLPCKAELTMTDFEGRVVTLPVVLKLDVFEYLKALRKLTRKRNRPVKKRTGPLFK